MELRFRKYDRTPLNNNNQRARRLFSRRPNIRDVLRSDDVHMGLVFRVREGAGGEPRGINKTMSNKTTPSPAPREDKMTDSPTLCECVECCEGEHAGDCRECAGWGSVGSKPCEYCSSTGICPICKGASLHETPELAGGMHD